MIQRVRVFFMASSTLGRMTEIDLWIKSMAGWERFPNLGTVVTAGSPKE
jgi:hypothetical protein